MERALLGFGFKLIKSKRKRKKVVLLKRLIKKEVWLSLTGVWLCLTRLPDGKGKSKKETVLEYLLIREVEREVVWTKYNWLWMNVCVQIFMIEWISLSNSV